MSLFSSKDAEDAALPWVYPRATRNQICGLPHCDLKDKDGYPCTFAHPSRSERIRARDAWIHHQHGNPTEEEEGGPQSKRVRPNL